MEGKELKPVAQSAGTRAVLKAASAKVAPSGPFSGDEDVKWKEGAPGRVLHAGVPVTLGSSSSPG